MTTAPDAEPTTRGLGPVLVTIAFLGAVIGGVGAPLITSVALDVGVSLGAAQWTLTVTLFAGAISAPILGRLGTGPHRRGTVLVTLGLVAFGGFLTAVPLPFAVLLVGRALQGLGLGVIALLMSVARDHLPADRAQSTIATISVAGTVGIGVAYPLMGMLDQAAGLRAAYGAGFLLSLSAVVIAWHRLPTDPPRPAAPVDFPGAVLLGIGTLGVLLAVAQPSVWHPAWGGALIVAGASAALGVWIRIERRVPAPLVDLAVLAKSVVLQANGAMLTAGAGMYLLFSLLTRYVQTPDDAGYGFGLSGVLAGAALIPFSLLGFIAGKFTPWLTARAGERWTFVMFAGCVVVAAGTFASAPRSLAAVLVAMGVLGFGVGGASAIMPRLVLDGVPRAETSSVLSINQIVRTVGFSIGSALAGLLLAIATPDGAVLPREYGYPGAAFWVLPLAALSALIVVAGRRRNRA